MRTRRDPETTAAVRRRPGRIQRMRAAGIATLLVGAVACSAAPAVATPTLVRAGGPAGAFGGYATSGAYATAVSTPATAQQSAGVVLIETVLPYQNAQAAGTGMVLTASGQVLTNYHVVEGAGTITVTVAATGQSFQATVVGADSSADVALLQLTGASGLTTVKADDEQAQVGETVTAVGNAGGTGTLTAAAGTISSLTASVTAASDGSTGSETLSSMIETTADVVSGDSGGPLFDAEGEVVGIDTAASVGVQIDGYAIPIARALAVVEQIRSGTETSSVRIGPAAFLGVELSSGVAYGYGYARSAGPGSGATLSEVVTGTAAASAGLQAGDVITTLNGRAIGSASDVSAALVGADPGDQVTIGWTDTSGSPHTATVTLGASPVA
ncbi:MAG TPA: trypsin-like peptidase domain-containing protein [Lapillicoccus sp.]